MANTNFKGPVISENGFEGSLTGAVTATTVEASTSVAIGSGTAITKILKGTVSINPASISNGAVGEESVTITGAAVGDAVILHPPAAGLTAGLVVCEAFVSATNTVKVRLYNSTGAPIDEAAANWIYVLIRS